MKISKDCLDAALTALKDFDSSELKQYAFEVFEKAKEYPNLSNMKAFQQAMKDINNEHLQSYFESVTTAANNAMKIEAIAKRIEDGKANFRNTLIKLHANQGHNVSAAQAAAHEELQGTFFNKVTREQVAFLSNEENDLIIADAYDGKKVTSPDAKFIADLWKDVYFPERNAELITSNAMPFNHINEDRTFRNIHDSNKLILGGRSAINEAKSKGKFDASLAKKKWIDTIKQRFDLIHSDAIDANGVVDQVKYDKILGDMYDNITTGKSDIFTRSLVVNDRIAIQNRSRRRLQPKSMRDFVEYNKEYGHGNLFSAMLTDMQTSANKIGVARILGDSPHAAYLDLKKVQQKVNRKEAGWWEEADLYFNDVMGIDKTAVNPRLAAFDANTRAYTAMARLPLVALRSLPDINSRAIFAMNHGYNYFSAWGNHLKYIFDLYPSSQRKYLAKRYASMFRQHLGYMARFGEVNNMSVRTNKITTKFFKYNGLHGFDQGGKLSGIELVSRSMGEHSNKTFDKVPLATRNWIAKFLEPDEWELLRHKSKNRMFTTDNVDALSSKEIKEFYDKSDKRRPLHEIRNDLYRQVHAMAQIASENMILNPGAFERAFLLRGTKPGTPQGILLRQLSHFKTFTLSFIDKVLVQGYKNADANQMKLQWAAATLIGALPLNYAVMTLENFAMGKTMPDISKMSAGQRIKFLIELIAPGMALFSGVLDQKHVNADQLWSLVLSPSLRLMFNAIGSATVLASGDSKKIAKQWYHTASYMLPIKTTPVLSPMLNQAMGEKGYLEPGQKHIYGK